MRHQHGAERKFKAMRHQHGAERKMIIEGVQR